MKFIDLFSGIGGFRLGMEMAGHECVGHCEIDKFADISYRAMHEVKKDEWYADDIRTVKPGDLPEADCYCFGFPCQSFSIAGKRGGFSDTRGTLFFEVMRLAKERKPKILFAENVKGLLNHDKGRTFGTIIRTMDELGYDVEWQLLNSKDFGVPQNRERVFIIGHLRGRCGRKVFPIRGCNGQTIKQVNHLDNWQGSTRQINRVYSPCGLAPTLNTCGGGSHEPKIMQSALSADRGGIAIKEATKKGYAEAYPNDSVNIGILNSDTRRGRVGRGVVNTLTTQQDIGIVSPSPRIRKLTPKECFRLQGFPDEYYERAANVNSDSQLYKQAGNSVTVNVINAIAKELNNG